MDHKHVLRSFLEPFQPAQQAILIRMPADPLQDLDLGVDFHRFTEQLNKLCPFHQLSSQGSGRLIPYKTDRTLLSPQIVLQMMPDPSRLTHAGSR